MPPVLFTEEHVRLWSELLEQKTGVQLGEIQDGHLKTQITMRMRELNTVDVGEYYQRVSKDLMEWAAIMERLLVKETHFFRSRESISLVKNKAFKHLNSAPAQESFDVWSLGCSTGEEAYGLAAVIFDCFRLAVEKRYFSVLGTDISASALAHARNAVYGKSRLLNLSDEEKKRYFDVVAGEEKYKIRPEIAARVTFVRGNICELDKMPRLPMDVIYCQNLLVYFRRWRRKEILTKLIERLKPKGLLIVGAGEIVGWRDENLTPIPAQGVQAYQRI